MPSDLALDTALLAKPEVFGAVLLTALRALKEAVLTRTSDLQAEIEHEKANPRAADQALKAEIAQRHVDPLDWVPPRTHAFKAESPTEVESGRWPGSAKPTFKSVRERPLPGAALMSTLGAEPPDGAAQPSGYTTGSTIEPGVHRPSPT